MRILEPTATYVPQQNAIDHVAYCASVCYDSTPKTGKDAEKFVLGLMKAGHLSVLRHASHYYIVRSPRMLLRSQIGAVRANPYIEVSDLRQRDLYIATNWQFLNDHNQLGVDLEKYEVTPKQFASTEIGKGMMRYTFVLETQISTARELARHSPQNFTERSTRYIKGQEAIVRPVWLDTKQPKFDGVDDDDYEDLTNMESAYLRGCEQAFCHYDDLLKCGLRPEDARGVLPLDTYTKVVMTHSVEEWRKIIHMRVYGTTGRPHPNIAHLIGMVQDQINELGYDL